MHARRCDAIRGSDDSRGFPTGAPPDTTLEAIPEASTGRSTGADTGESTGSPTGSRESVTPGVTPEALPDRSSEYAPESPPGCPPDRSPECYRRRNTRGRSTSFHAYLPSPRRTDRAVRTLAPEEHPPGECTLSARDLYPAKTTPAASSVGLRWEVPIRPLRIRSFEPRDPAPDQFSGPSRHRGRLPADARRPMPGFSPSTPEALSRRGRRTESTALPGTCRPAATSR